MKNLLKLLVALLVAFNVQAQTNCKTTSSLVVSTGYDPVSSSTLPIGSFDPMWRLIQSPTPPAGWTVSVGGPAYTIPQSSAWDAVGPTSTYINAFSTNSSVLNNWSLSTDEYIFEREFCICDPSGGNTAFPVDFDLSIHADNWAEVRLVPPTGAGMPFTLFSQPYVYSTANFQNPTDDYVGTHNLTPGTYKLQISLRNQQVQMGVNMEGTISSPGVLTDDACVPTGGIAGYKYNDVDNNGVLNPPTDVGLLGWTIQLYDASNNLVATTTTDMNGFYFFNDVTPGVYTVKEVNQSGWTMLAPATGTHTGVNVTMNSIAYLNFLNVEKKHVPCEFDAYFKFNVENCKVDFASILSGVPAGYNIASISWTFGDGYSSNEFSPTHYYTNAGVYGVCLTVTLFDGVECCTKTFCKKIKIEKECGKECDIKLDMKVKEGKEPCSFNFLSIINFTSTPISSYYWDFGDGNTSMSANPQHTYTSSGTYVVCLTVFGTTDPRTKCCFKQICKEIKVDCKGKREATKSAKRDTGTGNLDEASIKAVETKKMSVYPNPSEGNFKIMLDLDKELTADLSIVDINGKLVYSKKILSKEIGKQVFNIEANLKPGLYTCMVTNGSQSLSSRIIIE